MAEDTSEDDPFQNRSVGVQTSVSESTVTKEELTFSESSSQDILEDDVLTELRRPSVADGGSASSDDSDDSDSESTSGSYVLDQSETQKRPKTYHIAREILTTERTLVEALRLVYEEFLGTLKKANNDAPKPFITDSLINDIFLNIGQIYELDCNFLNELEERMASWDLHERIGDIIKKFGHFLLVYTTFIKGHDNAMIVFQDTVKKNPQFKEVLTQFQANPSCKNLPITAFMLKPIQRIPSYRLLLLDYLKHLDKDSLDFKDISASLEIVSEVATHINDSMKKVDNFEHVLRVQRCLTGHREIVKPGRDYIREGMLMKLCRKDLQPRYFFLFTDILLYTFPMVNNQYKVRNALQLVEMRVSEPEAPDFENEFSVISTTRSFTLAASTPEERDKWIEDLNEAIGNVTKKMKTFTNNPDPTVVRPRKQGKLGDIAPVWIQDSRATMCMICSTPFYTITNRRHHCRACGKVVCRDCSANLAPLKYLDYQQARVCDQCIEILEKDITDQQLNHSEKDGSDVVLETTPRDNTLTRQDSKKKPSKEQLQRMLKRRSSSQLGSRSNRTSRAFRNSGIPTCLTEVTADEGGCTKGYLRMKRGKHTWKKKQWFVLKGNVLYVYKASSDSRAQDSIVILGYKVTGPEKLEGDDKKHYFKLEHVNMEPMFLMPDNANVYDLWGNALKKAVISFE